jgi:putative transposase
MRRAFKYRLFTNINQARELDIMLETHRRLYNACLQERKSRYETDKITVRYTQQSKHFTTTRATHPYYARVNFSSAQATMRRLDKACQAFFRRVTSGHKAGYPRFKARDRFDSIEFPAHGDGVRFRGARLRVQHVGVLRVRLHRPVEGMVKTITLKRETNKWYVIASCDLGEMSIPPSKNPPVGIDVGIESFLTTSNGEHEPNPAYLKMALPELRRRQRAVSRKVKGGANRRKAITWVTTLHARVRNLRKEHHHSVALKLTRRYGLIAVERLNITGMLKNHRLSRVIADAAWGGFLATLRHKAERAGVAVVEVNPQGTSQRCSGCGRVVAKTLAQRWHSCDCGVSLHRDHNAAREILALARMEPAGVNMEMVRVA